MRSHPIGLRRTPAALAAAALLGLAPAAGAVDGVIEINQAKALAGDVTATDTAGFPVTIDAAGSYRLTGNLALANNSQKGIEVLASNVTIDLNGFEIACDSCGSAGGGVGVEAFGGISNVTVRNGTIRSTGGPGVSLQGPGSQVDGVRVLGAWNIGIRTGTNGHITNNTVADTSATGISGDLRCHVANNVVDASGSRGIKTLGTSTIRDNVVAGSSFSGIECTGDCTITGNVSENNGMAGIDAGNNSVVAHNVATDNTLAGIDAAGSVVVDNLATGNDGLGLEGDSNTGYGRNVLSFNNSNGDQVSAAAHEIDVNVCQGDTTCP